MISPSSRVRILVATQLVGFRKGHDGLTAMVQSVLRKAPFSGTVFVFRVERLDRLKLLYWDGNGLVMADIVGRLCSVVCCKATVGTWDPTKTTCCAIERLRRLS